MNLWIEIHYVRVCSLFLLPLCSFKTHGRKIRVISKFACRPIPTRWKNLPPTSLPHTAHKPNTTTHPRTLPHHWCTCTTTLASTTHVYHSIACPSEYRDVICRLQYSTVNRLQVCKHIRSTWCCIATAMNMPPSFNDIIQQATTHRTLTIAIPIVTIMKSWHQYISLATPTTHLNLWTLCWRMDDGDAICFRWWTHTTI